MKASPSILIFCIAHTLTLKAQEPATIRVKADTDLKYAIPVATRYRYPQFKEGTVSFLNGTSAHVKLNYNFQLGEVQFIGPARDTLSLANEQTIKKIQMGDNTFYYDLTHGYVESIAGYPKVQLVIKTMFKVAAVEKMAGMGKSSATSSIKELNTLTTANSSVQKLASKGDVVFSKESIYFLMDDNRRFYKTNKSGFLKLFSAHKKAIETHLKENPIDFDKEEDLKKLLAYCSGL
ncbi:MAG: hypothetical protein R2822_17655 [Spirosomataceae bacterium]